MVGNGRSALAARVETAIARGQGLQYLAALDAALRGPLPDVERASLLALRGRVHRQGLDYTEMLRDTVAAADLFHALDDRDAESRAVAVAAVAAAECGELLTAADLAVRARVAGGSLRDAGHDVDPWVLNRLGIFCHQMYDMRGALDWWHLGLDAARRSGDGATEVLLVHNLVEATYTAHRLGDQAGRGLDPSESVDRLRAVAQWAGWLAQRDDGRRRMPVDGPRVLAQVLAALGRPGPALEALGQARVDLAPRTATLVRSSFDIAEGYCLLVAGRAAEALAALDRGLAPRGPDAVDLETLLARRDRVDALQRLGRWAEALDESRRSEAMLVQRLRQQGTGVLREVDLRVEHERERARLLDVATSLVRDAQRDPLTGAGNRRRLDVLRAELADIATVGAVVVDLDRFKVVNDRFGHAVGDLVLVQTVEVMTRCCRSRDEVVRMGGEEFLVVCPDADAGAVMEVGERIRAALSTHDWEALVPGLSITASVGSATGPGAVMDDAIARADSALLLAKQQGRNVARYASVASLQAGQASQARDLSLVG